MYPAISGSQLPDHITIRTWMLRVHLGHECWQNTPSYIAICIYVFMLKESYWKLLLQDVKSLAYLFLVFPISVPVLGHVNFRNYIFGNVIKYFAWRIYCRWSVFNSNLIAQLPEDDVNHRLVHARLKTVDITFFHLDVVFTLNVPPILTQIGSLN